MQVLAQSVTLLVDMTVKDFLFAVRGGVGRRPPIVAKKTTALGEVISLGIKTHGILF
jgi:hypothetical protein